MKSRIPSVEALVLTLILLADGGPRVQINRCIILLSSILFKITQVGSKSVTISEYLILLVELPPISVDIGSKLVQKVSL